MRSYLFTPFHVFMAVKKGSRTSAANAKKDDEMEDEVYLLRQKVRLLEGQVQELEKEFEKSKQQMPASCKLTQYMYSMYM